MVHQDTKCFSPRNKAQSLFNKLICFAETQTLSQVLPDLLKAYKTVIFHVGKHWTRAKFWYSHKSCEYIALKPSFPVHGNKYILKYDQL